MVLLSGLASVSWSPDQRRPLRLGPRRDVFTDYPHAVYLPPGTAFEVRATQRTEIAECSSPSTRRFPPRAIRPEDCGLEVRGGGNATRQIIDILPPAAAADRCRPPTARSEERPIAAASSPERRPRPSAPTSRRAPQRSRPRPAGTDDDRRGLFSS